MRLHNFSNHRNLYQNQFIHEYSIKCDKNGEQKRLKVNRLISRDLQHANLKIAVLRNIKT